MKTLGRTPTAEGQDKPPTPPPTSSASGHRPMGMADFGYAVDAVLHRIRQECGMSAYLGHAHLPASPDSLLHPDERALLGQLTQRIRAFLKEKGEALSATRFLLTHRLRRADGDYIQVLCHLQPQRYDHHHHLLDYECLCVEVPGLPTAPCTVTLDIRLPPMADCTPAAARSYFYDLLPHGPPPLSPEEMAALRQWRRQQPTPCLDAGAVAENVERVRVRMGVRRMGSVVDGAV